MPKSGVASITITSWTQLMDEVYRDSWDPALGRHRSPFVYRGAADRNHELASSLLRLTAGQGGADRLERHLVRNFRKYAHSNVSDDTIWNWLAIAAHHGLPTRLLDWSYSPLVALHFATANVDLYNEDAVVWCVNHRETNQSLPPVLREQLEKNGSDVFTVEMLHEAVDSLESLTRIGDGQFVLFLEPPSLDARIVNQFALFSVTSSADQPLDGWLHANTKCTRRLVLPASLKWEIRDKLDQAGITERVLFPGLDGLTAWLTRYYAPRLRVPDGFSEGERNGTNPHQPPRTKDIV